MTEALWGHMKEACQETSDLLAPEGGWEEALIVARWPEPMATNGWEAKAVSEFNLTQEMVRVIRNVRAEYKVQPAHLVACTISAGEKTAMIEAQRQTFIHWPGSTRRA